MNFEKIISPENHNKIVIIILVLLTLLGIYNRFIQDDAFISFRYAQNFAEGHGLTWNPGEQVPVEGYTNFLWVMIIAMVEALGFDPVLWSMILGILFGLGTLYYTYQLSSKLSQSKWIALLSMIILGTNYTFSCYMTGGLETQLQTFLIILSTYYSFCAADDDRHTSGFWLLSLSVFYSLAVMTRPDSVLICGLLYLFLFVSQVRRKIPLKNIISRLALLTLPGILIIGIWLFFKLSYYGGILPNTFYVKALGGNFHRGMRYCWSFMTDYSLTFFLILGMIYLRQLFSKPTLLFLLTMTGVWCLYTIKVGGDFMEYRFFVPILPFIAVLIAHLILITRNSKVQLASAILLIYASFAHAKTFNGRYEIESVPQLNAYIYDKNYDWQRVGIVFKEMFSASKKPVIIATTAAGAIPYYSKLPTIDMFGLNDRWIARHGVIINSRPGHSRYSSIDYLLEADVNLVLGHPKVKPVSYPTTGNIKDFFWRIDLDLSSLPDSSEIIEIPLNSNYKIEVLYLKRHEYVDQKIRELDLKTHPIFKP